MAWVCGACTLENAAVLDECAACHTPREFGIVAGASAGSPGPLAAPAAAVSAPAGSSASAGASAGAALLDPAKLTSRVGVLVELRDGVGAGGVVCAEPRTHAAVRAGMVLRRSVSFFCGLWCSGVGFS